MLSSRTAHPFPRQETLFVLDGTLLIYSLADGRHWREHHLCPRWQASIWQHAPSHPASHNSGLWRMWARRYMFRVGNQPAISTQWPLEIQLLFIMDWTFFQLPTYTTEASLLHTVNFGQEGGLNSLPNFPHWMYSLTFGSQLLNLRDVESVRCILVAQPPSYLEGQNLGMKIQGLLFSQGLGMMSFMQTRARRENLTGSNGICRSSSADSAQLSYVVGLDWHWVIRQDDIASKIDGTYTWGTRIGSNCWTGSLVFPSCWNHEIWD